MATWNPDTWLMAQPATILLPALLFGEARGETLDGQLAVASIVRNRVLRTAYTRKVSADPALWAAVMTHPWAFSCFDADGGSWNARKTVAFARDLVQTGPQSPLMRQLVWVAAGAIGDCYRDSTNGSTHYFVRGTSMPPWAVGRSPLASIDSHDFYKLPDPVYV